MEKNEKEELGNPMKEFNSRYIYLYNLYAIWKFILANYEIKISKFFYY